MKPRRKWMVSSLVFICLSVFWQVGLIRAWARGSSELGTIVVQPFHDINRNGLQDEGDGSLENQWIQLYAEEGGRLQQIAESPSGADGVLVDLQPGSYKIWTELAECWLPTTPGKYWRGGYLTETRLDTGQQVTIGLGQAFTCEDRPEKSLTTGALFSKTTEVQPQEIAKNQILVSFLEAPYLQVPTNTATATPTPTPFSTATATNTATNTPVVPTATATNTATNTPVVPTPTPVIFEGCTPGYWKNHPNAWGPTGYSPSQTLESVFDVPDAFGLDARTLKQALSFGGGPTVKAAAQILFRAAVAALLNAAHPDVDYPSTTSEIITSVNAALASNDRDTILALASELDAANNLDCPLNGC